MDVIPLSGRNLEGGVEMLRCCLFCVCVLVFGCCGELFAQKGPSSKPQSTTACALRVNQALCLEAGVIKLLWERMFRRMGVKAKNKFYLRALIKSIVKEALLAQVAHRHTLTIPRAEVDKHIQATQIFHRQGVFDPKWYKEKLRQLKLSERAHRDYVRWSLLVWKLAYHVRKGLAPLREKQVWDAYKREREKVWLATISFPLSLYKPKLKMPADLSPGWMFDHQKQLQAYYLAHKKDFQKPLRIRARHILVMLPRGASGEVVAVARRKIEALRVKALAKPSQFAALARRSSEGPSKTRGGDLGLFSASGMVPSFARAAFRLAKPGDISPVVRTRFGFHVIQLTHKEAPRFLPLLRVQDKVARKIWRKVEREERITKALTWLRKAWSRYQGKLPFIQHLEVALGRTNKAIPPVVRAFLGFYTSGAAAKRTGAFVRKASGPLTVGSWLDNTEISAKIFQMIHQLQPNTVLMKPLRLDGKAYLLRLLSKKVATKAQLAKERKSFVRGMMSVAAFRKTRKLGEKLYKNATIKMNQALLKTYFSWL